MNIKKGDTVVVISGSQVSADKKESKKTAEGKRAVLETVLKKRKVLEVAPAEGKIIVEGANIKTKHVKPRKQGQAGGILKAEGAIYASKVMLVCPKCNKPTKVGHATVDGKSVRVCKICKETF